MLLVTAAIVLHETRGTTLWFDEWAWALERRSGGLGSLLEPHNGHWFTLPILGYQVLFRLVGVDRYLPYFALALLAQPAEGVEPGSIIQVVQRGYRLGDAVLRPARVIVAE
jgi:hypothetical protein